MSLISAKAPKLVVKKSTTILERFQWICNTIFHQLVAIVGVFILWTLCYNFKNNVSRWHMILTTIAYMPLMAEAIILFASDNVWSQNIQRSTRYYIHGSMLFISAILATVGIAFMINSHSSPHFRTNHGWTGFVSWIFVLLSQCLGLASAKAQSLKFLLRPVWFKLIHNLFGMLGYLFGVTSLCYGLEKQIFSETAYESRLATTILIGLIAFWSLLAAFKSIYNQIKAIIS